MNRVHLRALATVILISILFYWKFLLTRQYSLLTGFEGANQAYSWYNFIAHSLKAGSWPLWDPYAFSGHSFAGEMQTAAFYPLNLLLAAVPFNNRGLFSPNLYHWLYLGAHVLGAYFMFALVRNFGLSFYASILSGICFSLGGFMARVGGWPHMYQSALWLPLICLAIVKALGASSPRRALAFSMLGGFGLGLSILAGGLHVVMTQAILVVTAGVAYVFLVERGRRRELWRRAVLIAGVVLALGAATGAVQLLPSMEYSQRAMRWIGSAAVPASDKIPYHGLEQGLLPNAFLGLLFGFTAAPVASGEYINPYFGVLPLLLAVIGIWKCRQNPWVRYFTILAAAAFLYALGGYSLLHGLAYALVPFLWLAREAGRSMYLADFGLAVLAGFGVDQLFAACPDASAWHPLKKLLRWLIAACVVAMAVPVVYGKPEVNPMVLFSLLLIILSCGLVLYILQGHAGPWPRLLVLGLVLFDLYAFDWSAANRAQEAAKGSDQLERLLSLQDAAKFLRSQDGFFRVDLALDLVPNMGDLYGVQTTWGAGVTALTNYDQMRGHTNLLNVRYILRPASAAEPGAVYQDRFWKIYENPAACPRAWLVHETEVQRSPELLRQRLDKADFDPLKLALVYEPLRTALDRLADPAGESVVIDRYSSGAIELRTQARGRALLVLSEIFYPGWRATVNGKRTDIIEVDRALRGIPVPDGASRVAVSYAPRSILAGATLTLLSFFLLPLALLWLRRQDRQHAMMDSDAALTPGRAGGVVSNLRRLLLEDRTHQPVHLDGGP